MPPAVLFIFLCYTTNHHNLSTLFTNYVIANNNMLWLAPVTVLILCITDNTFWIS